MFYYLSKLSEYFGALNVFQYLTFRAVMAGITAFLVCLIFGNLVIRKLLSLKFGQPIRTKEEVNRLAILHGGKAGTPTMGGVLLIGAVVISSLCWAKPENPFVWVVLFTALVLAGLGFLDDYLKVSKQLSAGISGKIKLLIQFTVAGVITFYFLKTPELSGQAQAFYVPFFKDPLIQNLGIFTFLFYAAVIVGSSNAVNLTDGLDGLAAGCSATVAFSYGILAYLAGNIKTATYLQIPYITYSAELTVVCMALAGATLGFLWYNCHPAKVFMGDTGSLAIGGMIGAVAICCKQELLLLVVGGVFVMEALSVIIQVFVFKMTGKRVFAMSPIHHHFELKGWKENTVIVRFWILGIMFALMGLATLKLR